MPSFSVCTCMYVWQNLCLCEQKQLFFRGFSDVFICRDRLGVLSRKFEESKGGMKQRKRQEQIQRLIW